METTWPTNLRRLTDSNFSANKRRVVFYTILVIALMYANIFSVVPPGQPVSLDMTFLYPHSTNRGMTIWGNMSLYIQIHLSADQTIAEGVLVKISNVVGTIGFDLARDFDGAAIVFEGAQFCTESGPIPTLGGLPAAGPALHKTSARVTGLNLILSENLVGSDVTICWPHQGDHNPTLEISLENGNRVITEDYPENRVHVESLSVVQQERASAQEERRGRNIENIEIAILAGIVFEAFNVLGSKRRKPKKKTSEVRQDKNADKESNRPGTEDKGKIEHKRRPEKEQAEKQGRKHPKPSDAN